MKIKKDTLFYAHQIIGAYSNSLYLGTFKDINTIAPEEKFESHARKYYIFLLESHVPEELRKNVDEKIQELRPELKSMVNELVSLGPLTEEQLRRLDDHDPEWLDERKRNGYFND